MGYAQMIEKDNFLENFDTEFENELPKEFLDKYIILECFNSTDKSDALLAEDKSGHKRVVAKCFSNKNALYENIEDRVLKDTDNSSIPKFIEEFKNDNYYIVLREYVEGISLDEYMRAHKLDYKSKLELAIKLAKAMRELHTLNPVIIHRDIKPQNIIVKEDESIAFIDFEISRIYKQGENEDTTIGGTAGYAAPEQYGFMQTDVRSDIYSYGIVLAWILTGSAAPLKNADSSLEKISRKCTEFLPDKRYKNDDALIAELERAYEPYDEKAKKKLVARRIGIAALVIAAVVCVVAFFMNRHKLTYKFNEPIIEEAVRASLDKPSGRLTYEDLENVTGIYIVGEKVFANEVQADIGKGEWANSTPIFGDLEDISDLENMPNLKEVVIVSEQVKDISALSDLDKLEHVDLQGNIIEDISALEGKTKINYLSFNSNSVTSIAPIAGCTELTYLDLYMAGSFDGSPLGNLKKITFLNICNDSDAYNYIDGLLLDELDLNGRDQTDVSCVNNVGRVSSLSISYSDITDISALEGRKDITSFNMSGCRVEDISPLWTMPNLEQVMMGIEQEEQVNEYIKEYGEPSFEIIYM